MNSFARRLKLALKIASRSAFLPDQIVLFFYATYLTIRERLHFLPTYSVRIKLNFNGTARSVWMSNLSDIWVIKDVLVDREYDVEDLSPKTIIDIGCNIGISTLFLAHKYPEAKVYAIEPNPRIASQLAYNVRGIENVELFSFALSNQDGSISMRMGAYSTSASLNEKKGEEISVESVSADNLLKRLQLTNADLVKFDIEGAEQYLFESKVLEHIDALIGEVHYDRMDMKVEDVNKALKDFVLRTGSAGRDDRAILYAHR